MPADFSSAALELANELRERRKAAGFPSQDALARVLNCDRTRVTKAENGGMFGSFDIASASGVPDTMRMSAVADQTTDNLELIREATMTFELIRGRALDAESSRAVIVEAIERWKNQ